MTFASASNQTVGGGVGGTVPGLSQTELTNLREVYLQDFGEEYAKKMAKLDAGGSGGFNVLAAFFPGLWLAARKLYRYWPVLVFLVVLSLLPAVCFHFIKSHAGLVVACWVAVFLTGGLLGTKWLWRATGLEIKRALSIAQGDLEQAKNILRKRGGTSVASALLCFLLMGFPSMLLDKLVLEDNMPGCSAAAVKKTLAEILQEQADWTKVRVVNSRTLSSQSGLKICSAMVGHKGDVVEEIIEEINFKVGSVDNKPGAFIVIITK